MTKFILLLILVVLSVTIINCSRPEKQNVVDQSGESQADSLQPATGATAAAVANEPKFKVDKTFQGQLADVFSSYLTLKEALVSSDSVKVRSEAIGAGKLLNKVELKLLSGEALNEGEKYLPAIDRSLKELHTASTIEKQRTAFSVLSDSLYITIKAFGLGGKEAFYDFCPMAFNEKGAYWLSDQEKIRNPYFGDKMLTCGEVRGKGQMILSASYLIGMG